MKNKRGFSNLVIGIVAVVILVLIVVGFNSTSTGKATQTEGAVYGDIVYGGGVENKNCVYVTIDDGWDVMRAETLTYFSISERMTRTMTDRCVTDLSVMEYDCEGTAMNSRPVRCPALMICEEGRCVGA